MFHPTSSCDDSLIESLLAGRLDRNAVRSLESHLDACQACRERVEVLAAAPAEWAEVREQLSHLDFGSETTSHSSPQERTPRIATKILEHLAPTDDPQMLGRLGSYEISGVIGFGGMGIVLKGWDRALNRFVAIKVLAPHLAASPLARRRFSREAQAAAAVVHDNIVAIHGVSEAGGLPYLVMPYIPGPSLQNRIDERGPLALVEALRIGHQIAAGLAAAHAQGLVHRDIKPANILLEEGIERLRITDFGLARTADDASLTQEGTLAGTPQYMSPEQARGEPVGPQSDLFSLGSLLYTVCTGRPPFRGETSYGILRGITDQVARPVRELNAEMPPWLEAIVHKLLSKEPGERFATAQEVAQLLQECLAHVQHPTIVSLPARALELMHTSVGGTKRPSRWSTWHTASMVTGSILVMLALGWWAILAQFHPANPGVEDSGRKAAAAPVAFHAVPEFIPATPGFIRSLSFSADGEWLAAGASDHAHIARSNAGAINIWHVSSRRLQTTLREDFGIFSVAFSPQGEQVALGNGRGVVKVVDRHSGELLWEEKIGTGETAVSYSAKGKWLAGGCQSGALVVWDATTRKKLTTILEGLPEPVLAVSFSPDETRLAAGGGNFPPEKLAGSARVWDLSTGNRLTTLRHNSPVMDVTFSPDNTLLASACLDARARLFLLQSGEMTHSVHDPESGLVGIRFRDEGKSIVTLGPKSGLKLWLVGSDREPVRLRAGVSQLTAMALSPNGKLIACGGHGPQIQLWDIERQEVVSELPLTDRNELPLSPILSLAVSADKSLMAVGREDGGIVIREIRSGRLIHALPGSNKLAAEPSVTANRSATVSAVELQRGHSGAVNALVFLKSGREIISAGADGDLRVWSVESGQPQKLIRGHTMGIRSLAISPDGSKLIVGSRDREASLWEVATGREIRRWGAHDSAVNSVVFAPDGTSILTAGEDGFANRWKTDNGDLLITCDAHRVPIHALALTADGRTVATGDEDGRLLLWNAATGLDRRALPRQGSAVRYAQFSDDGLTLISSGDGGGFRVWDVSTFSQRQALTGHAQAVTGLTLFHNQLVTVSLDGTTKLWKSLTSDDEVGSAP